MSLFEVSSDAQVLELLEWASAEKTPLKIEGSGSKNELGLPVEAEHTLSLKGLKDIKMYEPGELVMQAGAGAALSDIEAELLANNQRLAFSPPDLGPLYGKEAGLSTLGGVFNANLSGSSRNRAGAARDHLLGVQGVTGRGQAFQTGSRVMKNVTGYDLCKLVAGSYGTVTVCTDFTFKVLPNPEKVRTILIYGQGTGAAVLTMRDAMSSVHEVVSTAYIPANMTKAYDLDYVSDQDQPITALLIEGAPPSVAHRNDALKEMFKEAGEIEELHGMRSRKFWSATASVTPFAADQQRLVWRVSLPPSDTAEYLFRLGQSIPDLIYYLDWAGGLIWLSVPADTPLAGAEVIRGEIRNGGHATLMRAPEDLRLKAGVFQPLDPIKMRITEKIREGFDPYRILNPGRMYPVSGGDA
ncbi:FAD-binding protein [Sneathiella limimaris]|uniref:FAD-binding protein n=1 Tax=Sneathiella limimaris TaxID=1964213 RepID=UPI001469EA99|nr:FAD-binding protein [Sneathiella limimaris]